MKTAAAAFVALFLSATSTIGGETVGLGSTVERVTTLFGEPIVSVTRQTSDGVKDELFFYRPPVLSEFDFTNGRVAAMHEIPANDSLAARTSYNVPPPMQSMRISVLRGITLGTAAENIYPDAGAPDSIASAAKMRESLSDWTDGDGWTYRVGDYTVLFGVVRGRITEIQWHHLAPLTASAGTIAAVEARPTNPTNWQPTPAQTHAERVPFTGSELPQTASVGSAEKTPSSWENFRKNLPSVLGAIVVGVLAAEASRPAPVIIPSHAYVSSGSGMMFGNAIESHISGQFEGWSGETIFQLDNGQIWQQSSYAYLYHYAYRPKVLIVRTSRGYEMHVDGVSASIVVKPLN